MHSQWHKTLMLGPMNVSSDIHPQEWILWNFEVLKMNNFSFILSFILFCSGLTEGPVSYGQKNPFKVINSVKSLKKELVSKTFSASLRQAPEL